MLRPQARRVESNCQSCLASSQFLAEDSQVLQPGLYVPLLQVRWWGQGVLGEAGSRVARAPFCQSHLNLTLTSEVSDFSFWCLPLPHPSFIFPSPPGSYCLAPNQLDAATLGSAALACEQCLKSWHCGKPKTARHAHNATWWQGERGARTQSARHWVELCAR